LFNEHYVVKDGANPEVGFKREGLEFKWHRVSCTHKHASYIIPNHFEQDADKQLALCGHDVEDIPYISSWVCLARSLQIPRASSLLICALQTPLDRVHKENGTLGVLSLTSPSPPHGEDPSDPCSAKCSELEARRKVSKQQCTDGSSQQAFNPADVVYIRASPGIAFYLECVLATLKRST